METASQEMETANPLFYNDISALDTVKHKKIGFTRLDNYAFAKGTHVIPCLLEEVPLVAREYPITFARVGDKYVLVAILGFTEDENAYINMENKWMAEYIPAYARRYPFISVAVSEDGEDRILCIDETAEHFNSADGEPIFNRKGEFSEVVELALAMTNEFDVFSEQTEKFCDAIGDVNVLEGVTEISEFGNVSFYGLNMEAFSRLTGKKINELQEAGYLNILMHIANSQKNWRLIEQLIRLNNTEMAAAERKAKAKARKSG